MTTPRLLIRKGGPADLPACAALDVSFPSDWVLYCERIDRSPEVSVRFRWRRAKPPGSRRSPPLDAEFLAQELARSEALLLAEQSGMLVGYLIYGVGWNRTAEIVAFGVDLPHRRQGIGTALVEAAKEEARRRGLRALTVETQTDNRSAIDFYHALGFRLTGYNDHQYRNDDIDRQERADFLGMAVFLSCDLQ